MSLDFTLKVPGMVEVLTANITHNLSRMAVEAGIYQALWRPEENPAFRTAGDLVPVLQAGYDDLRARPEHYRQFDAPNGWGRYEHFVEFVAEVLKGCLEYPDALVEAHR